MSIEKDIPAIFLSQLSPRAIETIGKVQQFVDTNCVPADPIFHSQLSTNPELRWKLTPEIMDKLKLKAQEEGLWNLFLNKRYAEGPGYTNLEYGLMAFYMGRCFTAPEATNCNAPDTGNMELLARFGTPYQKKQWLQPLLDGKIRSAFLMTEKGVSSSNALNISTTAIRNSKGNFVLNGVKWFALGAGDPRCSVWLVMCKTSEDAAVRYRNHSVLVLDAKKAIASGKAKVIRPLTVYGYDDAPHGHCEIEFNDYVIDDEEMEHCILAAESRGFELIQSRLGPGRIHHCMRLIGAAEYAMLKVVQRANTREIFGKLLKDRENFMMEFAQHKINIERCKLLVLNAAHKIDISSTKDSQREISIAKIETPRTVLNVIDWCLQMYGAEGVSQDTPLSYMWAANRTLRIADGPDEAHLFQLARREAKQFAEVDEYFQRYDQNYQRLLKL
ncbi:uncharacterized protein KQ657_003312 [Scheffersomyces spartinae]|uniref:Acyl-CoA dehydrogenase n=1 Tax=Scheffersomyces spartinae TaxID=45513 RepID=A0A9P7VD07_9ASCO|nr:uncharacterized protein KQ657_003312 [Scheffersomyces spartinae]KAG7195547.1 hypothetical protein KQ657_003312 [Scheffersomyces spartinae]